MTSGAFPGIMFDSDVSDISRPALLYLYREMLRIRLVELKVDELYHEDEMKTPVHLHIGQEAIAAGVCAHLAVADSVFSNHRGHGHYLAKGGNLKRMIAELYNRETGCSRGRGGSMHLIDNAAGVPGTSSIVGGCVPLATGAALAASIRHSNDVSVAFFGDAAVEEGGIYESINFAVLKKLPVIYVCENNFYAVYTPLSKRQANDDISRRFEGLSVPGYRVDGNNVVEVYRVAGRAIAEARRGKGPSFLECRTYRFRDHHGTTSGVEVGYRTQEEVDSWTARCPVKNFRHFLVTNGIATEAELQAMAEPLNAEVQEAFHFAKTSPLPDPDDVCKYVFH